jgi:hypothetical protein
MPDFSQTLFGKSRDSVANDLINQANPGTSQPSYGVFDSFIGKTKINQIRGINQNNATGSGIPKQVTNVNVSVNNAQKGATCAVTVMFQRDPSDSSFSGVTVYVSGYQGNANPTQVAAGSTSPITFTLNNTGENVSFLVQAFGNSGSAPLSGSPSRGTTLPKSTTGGYGTNTQVSYNSSNLPAVSDGLTHGDSVWVHDPAFMELREDFLTSTANAEIGASWIMKGTITNAFNHGGSSPYYGQLAWDNPNSASAYASLILWSAGSTSTSHATQSFALLENPGWKASFIFKLEGAGSSSPAGNWSTANKSLYVGFSGASCANVISGTVSARPDVFYGVRYDTSATPGTLTLSSAAAASGGTTVYSGTITGGTNNAFVGLTFTVAGFTNSVNNGTFLCTASTVSALTLVNASGAAETHAATATSAGLNDSTFTFECVQNATYGTATNARRNAQGQVSSTGLTPTQGVWYRLDIVCASTGVLQMTLTPSSGSAASHTFTVPQMTLTTSASGQASLQTNTGRVAYTAAAVGGTTVSTNGVPVFSAGSAITISGLSGGNTALNGSWTCTYTDGTNLLFDVTASNIANNSVNATVVGYPAMLPCFIFGNDDTASPALSMRMYVDFFSLVWNPKLGPGAPGTPNSLKPRYW